MRNCSKIFEPQKVARAKVNKEMADCNITNETTTFLCSAVKKMNWLHDNHEASSRPKKIKRQMRC